MKEGWKMVKLGEVLATLRNGLSVKQKRIGRAYGEPISRIETIAGGQVDLGRVGYAKLTQEEKEHYILRRGDILFSHINSAAHIGKTAIVEGNYPLYHGMNLLLLRPHDNLLPQFLRYVLSSYKEIGFWKRICKQSVNQASVNQTDIRNVEIPLPPLEEQRRIVAFLDEAFAAIETARRNTERNLENAMELFEGYLENRLNQSGLNYNVKTLDAMLGDGDIVDHMDGNHGGDYPRKHEFSDSGVPYLSANCIQNGAIERKKMKYLPRARALNLRKGFAKTGDVLFAHNATVGPVALLETNEPFVVLGTSLTYYRPNTDSVDASYLKYYMQSSAFRKQYELVMRQSTRNQVPITRQRTFEFKLPIIDDQRKIVAELSRLETDMRICLDAFEGKLSLLGQLTTSILRTQLQTT